MNNETFSSPCCVVFVRPTKNTEHWSNGQLVSEVWKGSSREYLQHRSDHPRQAFCMNHIQVIIKWIEHS